MRPELISYPGRQATASTPSIASNPLRDVYATLISLVALVHDLGRLGRFLNMMRVFKVTSPMSVGSWILAGFTPLATVAAASSLTGRLRPLGALGTVGSAALGPALATYTAALISNTAVPAWHDGYREMPFLFAGSSAASAGGLGLVSVPASEAGCRGG